MMKLADYQVIAVALREGKRELVARGIIGPEARLAVEVLEANLVEALHADNPEFGRTRFEQDSYPY